MRVVIQRVSHASVSIDDKTHASIGSGLLVLIGICETDTQADAEWLSAKIAGMRIFSDTEGKMNLSIQDVHGEILLISQFTLFAATHKGNRPSFIRSARPDQAIPLYENFKAILGQKLGTEIKTGVFGADMQVSLLNDGPVTIIMDSQNKEF